MNKTLALVAVLGLVAAPAFAAPEAAPAEKKVMDAAAVDCSKAADKSACEKEQAAKKAGEAAPAAGEAKKEEAKH